LAQREVGQARGSAGRAGGSAGRAGGRAGEDTSFGGPDTRFARIRATTWGATRLADPSTTACTTSSRVYSVSISTIVLLSVLMLSVKPSVAVVPDLLMCRHRAGVVDMATFVPKMWLSTFVPTFFLQVLETSPCRGGAAEFFNFSLQLRFLLVTHVQFLFFLQRHSGASRTMSEGHRCRTSGHPQLENRRDRASGLPQLEHRWDRTLGHPNPPSCCEPPADSFLCIALVNLE
jgi:hypothetical protein